LPREVVESPFFKILKIQLYTALGSLLQLTLPGAEQRVGIDDSQINSMIKV